MMKFLIQKINGKVTHDFSLTLLESIRYQNWLNNTVCFKYKFINTKSDGKNFDPVNFKSFHKNYIPIGSVEFVCEYLKLFHDIIPEQINVPVELFGYAGRFVFNGDNTKSVNLNGKFFAKSNDKIKFFAKIIDETSVLEEGIYQFSELIDINSEWRAFVYKNSLVGLQNYSGDFTVFPDIQEIKEMIAAYKSAPIAYTLDVIVNEKGTYVCEIHSFFSCGLYGFANYNVLPQMFYRAFKEITEK